MYGIAQIKVQAASVSETADNSADQGKEEFTEAACCFSKYETCEYHRETCEHHYRAPAVLCKPIKGPTKPQVVQCRAGQTVHLTSLMSLGCFPSISHASSSRTPARIRTPPTAIPPLPRLEIEPVISRYWGINGLSNYRPSLTPPPHSRAPAPHPASPTHLHFTPFWVSPFSPWPRPPSPPPPCTAVSWRRARPARRSASSGCSCARGGHRAP